jgi:hypothetical protein
MPDNTVEDAMQQACETLLAGDTFGAMGYLTPEAFNELLSGGADVTNLPSLQSYTIDSHEEDAGEHRFAVRFQTDLGEAQARAAWRDVGGVWKITSLQIDPPG